MIAVMPVFCLTLHAAYLCRHAGACCTAGWDIPAEFSVVEAIRLHVTTDAPDAGRCFVRRPGGKTTLARRGDGSCVFFEPERGGPRLGRGLCAIHRQAGSQYLPSACRHFPRVVLNDPRGTFVTLSHFCPTAAAMLLDPGPLAIVEAPTSIALEGALDGLDATSVLPPLLRPGMLMDYEAVSAWERAGIAVFDRDDLDVDAAVDLICAATAEATRWSPGEGPLALAVERAFAAALRGRDTGRAEIPGDRPLRAFAAAHLFGSWALYQRGGLQGVIDGVRAALALLREGLQSGTSFLEAARAADLRLRHGR